MHKLDQAARRMSVPQNIDWQLYELPMEEAAKLRSADDYRESVRQLFLSPEEEKGLVLPWNKARGFRFRPGEMTIWTGFNGHKKSMMMGQVMLGLIAQNATCCIASLEMSPVKSLKRLARQFVGVEEPSQQYQSAMFDWLIDSMWFYNQVGTVDPKRMIAVARYAITELGVKHMVVDSLMKCGIDEDDLNKQKWFVNELHTLAVDTNAHIHLVAHAKKPTSSDESNPSKKYGVAGSGNITNLPDNVLVVYWNKAKDELRRKGEQVDDTKGDGYLICEKQREGDQEPGYKLYFDEKALQFKGSQHAMKMGPDDWKQQRWQ